jgi:hypothetical protein
MVLEIGAVESIKSRRFLVVFASQRVTGSRTWPLRIMFRDLSQAA